MSELKIISIILLFVITFQDFRFRAVSWYIFPALLGLYIADNYLSNGLTTGTVFFFTNLLIILIQLAGVFLYFILKNWGKRAQITNYLGLGDVLFFIVLAAAFSPFGFILFIVIALLSAILWYALRMVMKKDKEITIPLAGIMSGLLIMVIVAETFNKSFNLNSIVY